MITTLPIHGIQRRADARPRDEASVQSLAESIATVGLINPIRVRRVGPEWEVVAGSHRLAACQSLGLVNIDCIVVEDDDLHAELAMIDENLVRAELSASERAAQTARRKAIYEELHPETKYEARPGRAGKCRQGGDNSETEPTERFTADTAKATGKSERTIQRDAERGEKVIPEVMGMLAGTRLDTGAYLDKIKRLTPNEQVAAVKRDLAIDRERAKPKLVKSADDPRSDIDVKERHIAALMTAWNNASIDARNEFLTRIGKVAA